MNPRGEAARRGTVNASGRVVSEGSERSPLGEDDSKQTSTQEGKWRRGGVLPRGRCLPLTGVTSDCAAPPANAVPLTTGEGAILWACSEIHLTWNNQYRVFSSGCEDKSEIEDWMVCAEDSADEIVKSNCTDPPPNVNNAEMETLWDGVAVLYKCNRPGNEWISRAKEKLSQCHKGNWTPILDMCDEACPLPRDCSDVNALGHTEPGEFHIYPADEKIYDPLKEAEKGWLLAAYTDPSQAAHAVAPDDPMNGFGTPDVSPYFIGASRGGPFEVTLAGEPRHATYTHVLIARQEPWNFTLGARYHGDAGDSFSPNEGYNFTMADQSWWWDGGDLKSFFHKSSPLWLGESVAEMRLYVRPTDYDEERSCPALVGTQTNPAWRHTQVTVPRSRAPGTTVAFNCTKAMWTAWEGVNESASDIDTTTEGMEGSRRTSGVVECMANGTGMTPQWDVTLELPCVLTCPDNYNETEDGENCLRFHHSGADFGITSAALECHQDGASLTPIDRLANISLFEPDVYYYTASVRLDKMAFWRAGHKTVSKMTLGLFVLCQVSSQYGNIPEQRPDYTKGMMDCMAEGAALAFPETIGVLNFIAGLVRQHQIIELLVGVTQHKYDSWTGGGVYSPSSEVVQLAGQHEKKYHRLLRVPQEFAGNLTLDQMYREITNTSVDYVACQLYGLAACTGDPPSAPDNATLIHPVLNHRYNTYIGYSCYPGYFVLGNVSWLDQWAHCSGEMGGWEYYYASEEKPFLDCSLVEVCNETTILDIVGPYPNVTYSTNHRYLNGSVTIVCPPEVITALGNDTQITTCSLENDTYNYYPEVIPCNVCDSQPDIRGHNISWSENQTYVAEDRVNATCLENYRGAWGQEELQIVCSEHGWWMTSFCHPACPDPAEPGANITLDAPNNVSFVGDTVTYTCSPGTFLPQTYPNVKDRKVLTCKPRGRWEPSLQNPYCAKLCMNDPPSSPDQLGVLLAAPVTSTWDGFTREVGTKVELECTDGRVLPSLQANMTVECGEDETWTQVDINSLICRRVAPEDPPQPPGSEVEGPTPDNYWEGDMVSYHCPPDQMSLTGTTITTAHFNGSEWLLEDPDFSCHPVCMSDPPMPQTPGNYNWNGWSRVVNTQVELTCPDNYLFTKPHLFHQHHL
ncbi:hypothetical protein O3P69_014540 [Scylla paramamosain]|uniref:Sushi domain-containing protein n=1 Tax=Scylla paramamosain TaxID=85552 RepID=A0AAW0TD01_SCYPA